MSSIKENIRGNLVKISENLINIQKVLIHLLEANVLSVVEIQTIRTKFEKDPFDKNSELFLILLEKNMDLIWEPLKKTLQLTGNEYILGLLELNKSTHDASDKHITFFGPRSIRLSDFDNFEVIGSGGFGTVMKARFKKNRIKYAIKITKKHSHREIHSLVESKHPNIIKCESAWSEIVNSESLMLHSQFEDYIGLTIYCIQMELCSGRNLTAWISKPPELKTREDAKIICFQISLGVQSLHANKIIHRDLKPANILLLNTYQKGNIFVKIGDLGLSKQTYLESKAHRRSHMTNCGTEYYKSPEQESERDYDLLTDIFSMGVIFFEVLYSTVEKKEILITNVRNGVFPSGFNDNFPTERRLIKAMLSRIPKDRPNADAVTNHLKTTWETNITREPPVNDINGNTISNTTDLMSPKPGTSYPMARRLSISEKSGSKSSINDGSTGDDSVQPYSNSLEKYSTDNGVYYLRNNLLLSVGYSNDQLRELAKVLQNNLVALEIAQLTLNKRRCSIKVYLDRFKQAKPVKIDQESNSMQIIKYSSLFFWEILECLEHLSVANYSALCKDGQVILTINNSQSLNELKIRFQPRDQLDTLFFKNIDVPKNLGIVNIENAIGDSQTHTLEFPIKFLSSSVEQITLTHCTLIAEGKICPKQVKLVHIKIVQDREDLKSFNICDLFDFEATRHLLIHDNLGKTKLAFDISKLVELDTLDLNCSQLLNWSNSVAKINKFTLENFKLEEKTQMTIRELRTLSGINPHFIPQSIEKLHLVDCISNGKLRSVRTDLPNLKYLSIGCNQIATFTDMVRCPNLEILLVTLGKSCTNLTTHTAKFLEFEKVRKIRLDTVPLYFNGIHKLDTLILHSYDWKNVNLILTHFSTDNLVLWFDRPVKLHQLDNILQLFQNFNKRKTTAIGEFDLNDEEFSESNLKLYVERNARFYLFTNNSSKAAALDKDEIETRCHL